MTKRHRVRASADTMTFQGEDHRVVVHTDTEADYFIGEGRERRRMKGALICWVECTCLDRDADGQPLPYTWRRAVPRGMGEEVGSRMALEHLAKLGMVPSMYGARWGDR